MKQTPARRAVDRAARACDKAYLALIAVADFLPATVSDQFLAENKRLRELTDYLDKATWPDKMR